MKKLSAAIRKIIFGQETDQREATAYYTAVRHQKIALAALALCLFFAFAADWHKTLIVLFSAMTVLYFLDLLFNAFLIYRSMSAAPEISVTLEEMAARQDEEWPSYTIFCPLYKEWQVIPQFVRAMQRIDYPKSRLQIMFLLEEDDAETVAKIREFDLPPHFEIHIVPHSLPKTKPKAMNVGLKSVRGEHLVIYDAEDVPERDQLKKAVIALEKARAKDKRVICIQAKLNFYNSKQNILTRAFTAEYSLWFDLILPGLQSISAPIPLGGTSNHFRTETLRDLGGWDAYNVTEDCDLGMRLAKQGFRTAIVNSTTYEEANSDLLNWYRQRSRWIKGYVQTYFVHMRRPFTHFKRGKRKDLLLFQLIVGMKALSLYINPIMWTATVLYFLFRAEAGGFIETLFPGAILYIGVFSLLVGNFLYLYSYMIGCAKRGYDDLVKYAFLVPLYWLGMSLAAWKALYEIVAKPHYWAKTVHGLHLARLPEKPEHWVAPTPFLNPVPSSARKETAGRFRFLASGAPLLVIAAIFANIINFAFNAYLGRVLSLDDYGTVALVTTFAYLLALFSGALATTTTHAVSFLEGARNGRWKSFFRKKRMMVFFVGAIAALLWAVFTPVIAEFFHVQKITLIAACAPALIFGMLSSFNAGFLNGSFRFRYLAWLVVSEAGIKLSLAVILVLLGLHAFAALAIPASLFFAWFLSTVFAALVIRRKEKSEREIPSLPNNKFCASFYAASLMSGISVAAFLSIDIVLAKHFLSEDDAGLYGILSLVGKMIFFSGSLLNTFVIPVVGKAEGGGKDPWRKFRKIFTGSILLAALPALVLGAFGDFLVPLLFGEKARVLVPYFPLYSLAFAFFAISTTLVLYHLARKHYIFPAISLFFSLLFLGLLWQEGREIKVFVETAALVNVLYFAAVLFSHAFFDLLVYAYRNARDILIVWKKLPRVQKPLLGRKRILIFNWRDTESVFAGGAEVYIHSLAKRWTRSGHSVTMFTSNDGMQKPEGEIDGVRIIRRGGFYGVYIIAALYYLVKFRGKVDTIIDCQNGISFFMPLFAREPVYCLVHHVHQKVFRKTLPKALALFACFLEERLMPLVYRHCEFITVSESSRKEMNALRITDKKINVVHPGIDPDFLFPGEKSETPLIAYVGRLQDYKSVDVAVQAFPKILASVPSASMVIAGGGEAEEKLLRLVKELGLSDRVVLLGKVSESAKRRVLQMAWVSVNPSFMEGWGITVIEANACGTPVVASDVPGLRESVADGRTGLLVPYGDRDALAEKICTVLTDSSTRDILSHNALGWAKTFNWDASSEKFLDIILGPESSRPAALENRRLQRV